MEILRTRYVVSQVGTPTSFFEVIDTHAPFLKPFDLPSGEDYAKDKFLLMMTLFGEKDRGENNKAKHLRCFLNKQEILLLMDQMSRGVKGAPRLNEEGKPDGSFYPILRSMKGSQDDNYPQWEYTSRTLEVTYQAQLKSGVPGYIIRFEAQEGVRQEKGIVSPKSGSFVEKAMTALPLMTTPKGSPPSALHVAHQTLNYIQAREISRQVLWQTSIARLHAQASKGNEASIEQWDKFVGEYGK